MLMSSKSSSNFPASYSRFAGNPVYEEVMEFLKLSQKVKGEHASTIAKFNSLEEHYERQTQMTAAVYDNLTDIIQDMKRDHLEDLYLEKQKYTQIS